MLPLPVSLCYYSKTKAFQSVKKCLVKTDADQDLPSWSGIDFTCAAIVAHTGLVLLQIPNGSYVPYFHLLLLVGTAPEQHSVILTAFIPQSFFFIICKINRYAVFNPCSHQMLNLQHSPLCFLMLLQMFWPDVLIYSVISLCPDINAFCCCHNVEF